MTTQTLPATPYVAQNRKRKRMHSHTAFLHLIEIKPNVFRLPSESRPNVAHTCDLNGSGSCTCEAFAFNPAVDCFHLQALRCVLAWTALNPRQLLHLLETTEDAPTRNLLVAAGDLWADRMDRAGRGGMVALWSHLMETETAPGLQGKVN